MPPTHITVTGVLDRKTPVHSSDGIAPGGGLLLVEHGFIDRVRYSQAIRRSIGRGDLVPCDMNGASVASAELADSPDDIGGRIEIARAPQAKAKKETAR